MPDVVMPQLGETVTEGTITRWFKAVGDTVARDEPLFEVSTDKVDSEVPSPAAGTLAEIRVSEGDTVDVGTVLAVIGDSAGASGSSGASDSAGVSSVVSEPATAAAPVPDAPPAEVAAPSGAEIRTSSTPAGAPPAANGAPAATAVSAPPAPASSPGGSAPLSGSSGQPSAGPGSAQPVVAAGAGLPSTGTANGSGGTGGSGAGGSAGLLLSPVVRRLLADNDIDPSTVTGSGPGGRITREDVLGVIDARRSGGQPAPAGARAAAIPQAAAAPTEVVAAPSGRAAAEVSAAPVSAVATRPAEDDVVPFTNIRRRTAEHMVRSKATSAHALMVIDADFETVEKVRRTHGARFREEEGFSLTYLPFVARAAVEALRRWPHLNASVGDDALVVHRRMNLAIAVDLSFEGLVAPVVHDADDLNVRGMARRIRDLATRARSKRLSPDDLAGGTFTITNPGPFGTLMTGPIINQPQVGILSTDTVKRRPVAVTLPDGSEAVAIHSVGLISLTWDHRAVDGAYAAAFLHEVAEVIATYDWPAEF